MIEMARTRQTPEQLKTVAQARINALGHLAIVVGAQNPKAPEAPCCRETVELTRAILLLLPQHVVAQYNDYTIDAKATTCGAGVYEVRFFVKNFREAK
jgi:hypothetical protein